MHLLQSVSLQLWFNMNLECFRLSQLVPSTAIPSKELWVRVAELWD